MKRKKQTNTWLAPDEKRIYPGQVTTKYNCLKLDTFIDKHLNNGHPVFENLFNGSDMCPIKDKSPAKCPELTIYNKHLFAMNH